MIPTVIPPNVIPDLTLEPLTDLTESHGLHRFTGRRAARRRTRVRFSFFAALCMLVVSVLGCAASEETPAGPQPVINEQLNVSFAAIPAGFEVAENQGDTLRLELKEPIRDAPAKTEMWVEVSERSDFGIEITEIVAEQRAIFEAMPGGSFGGNQKLQTPSGQAYYSRGRYLVDSTEVEEVRVFQIHPEDNRLVTFYYRYPAGDDSGDRVMELLAWVAQLTGAGQMTTEEAQTSDAN